jgi:hypothetical protein
MDLNQLISNVGFPIAAFCAMFYMCNTTIKENTKAILECTTAIKLLDNNDRKEEKDNV